MYLGIRYIKLKLNIIIRSDYIYYNTLVQYGLDRVKLSLNVLAEELQKYQNGAIRGGYCRIIRTMSYRCIPNGSRLLFVYFQTAPVEKRFTNT